MKKQSFLTKKMVNGYAITNLLLCSMSTCNYFILLSIAILRLSEYHNLQSLLLLAFYIIFNINFYRS